MLNPGVDDSTPAGSSSPTHRSFLARHPIAVLLVVGTAFVWITQAASLLAGVDVMPAKLGELVVLLGLAVWISSVVGGRSEVRRLFAGLTRWRLGMRYLVLIAAMPVLAVGIAVATGTVRTPTDGWAPVAMTYRLFLVLGAVTGNLWEETVWAGFVQGRLMAARGLLVGSLLTAVPFFLIHLPLAFEPRLASSTAFPLEARRGGRSGVAARSSFIGQAVGSV